MLIRHIVVLAIHLSCVMEIYSNKMQGYIVGGKESSVEEFPHSVFIAISCVAKATAEYACGGSIINQVFILSAAHCFEHCDPDKSIVIVCIGATNYSEAENHRVKDIVIHENYTSKVIQHDIGLLKLRKPMQFNEHVQRISLMKRPPAFDFAEVAGWGLVDEKKSIESLILKVAVQNVDPVKKCKELLGYLPPNAFCANSVGGYAAEGDSGSALVIHRYIQIGIVSYKDPKISVSVVVYTNVSSYLSWITTTMYDMACNTSSF